MDWTAILKNLVISSNFLPILDYLFRKSSVTLVLLLSTQPITTVGRTEISSSKNDMMSLVCRKFLAFFNTELSLDFTLLQIMKIICKRADNHMKVCQTGEKVYLLGFMQYCAVSGPLFWTRKELVNCNLVIY